MDCRLRGSDGLTECLLKGTSLFTLSDIVTDDMHIALNLQRIGTSNIDITLYRDYFLISVT